MSDELSRYFVPGPTWVRPEVLQQMTRPMMGHRSSDFRDLATKVLADVKELFRTKELGLVATSSGTGLLEGALLNCVPRSVLVTTCGAFSERWAKIAQQLGLEVDILENAWGEPVDPIRLSDHLSMRRHHYDAVTITHNETSTGVLNDLAALSKVVHDHSADTLVLVDAVSSLGSAPVLFDEWKLDVCLASTQKGIAIPPGLTVFALSSRALEKAAKKNYRGTYFDFIDYQRNAETGGTPFTPSIPHFYALAHQLEYILRTETLEKRWERHRRMRDITLERTASFADPICPREFASVSVSALRPKSIPATELVSRMKKRGFILSSGYGKLREETFRIGHMGDISIEALEAMLDVLTEEAQ